jgi:hypothetical protein
MNSLLKDPEFWRMLDLMAHKRPNDHPNKEFIAKYSDRIAAARIVCDVKLPLILIKCTKYEYTT